MHQQQLQFLLAATILPPARPDPHITRNRILLFTYETEASSDKHMHAAAIYKQLPNGLIYRLPRFGFYTLKTYMLYVQKLKRIPTRSTFALAAAGVEVLEAAPSRKTPSAPAPSALQKGRS